MKTLLTIIALLPILLSAQIKNGTDTINIEKTKKYSFGYNFIIGAHNFNINTDDYNNYDSINDIKSKMRPAFGLGIFLSLNLYKKFDIDFSPSLYLGGRTLEYSIVDKDGTNIEHNMQIESTYIQFPLMLKYSFNRYKESNNQFFVKFGCNYVIDIFPTKKARLEYEPLIIIKDNDFFVEFSIGSFFYGKRNNYSIELKYSYGLLNIIKYDNREYSQVFNKLSSSMLSLSFRI